MKAVQESRMVPGIFIGRWTPKILFSLNNRPYRHGQLRRHLGTVSQRMLTRTLRNLEATGLIARTREGIKTHCRRVFVNPKRKDTRHSTQRHVPLGETKPPASQCRSAPSTELEVQRRDICAEHASQARQ
jgi:DNA-binding MarR family transcriptional regulator